MFPPLQGRTLQCMELSPVVKPPGNPRRNFGPRPRYRSVIAVYAPEPLMSPQRQRVGVRAMPRE